MTTLSPLRRTRLFAIALAALIQVGGSGVNEVGRSQVVAVEKAEPPIADRLTSRADQIQAFDWEIRALARLLDLPGMVVVVAQDGKIAHHVEWGHADVEPNTRATVNHLFLLASVTKTFTATLITQMVDEGLVSLDDRVIDYWYPSFFPVRIIPDYRLRHVLGHTAQGTPGSPRRSAASTVGCAEMV
jgi:CubicO group peptidase (beta-lactamase class C family)